jgi:hypothetical protein
VALGCEPAHGLSMRQSGLLQHPGASRIAPPACRGCAGLLAMHVVVCMQLLRDD